MNHTHDAKDDRSCHRQHPTLLPCCAETELQTLSRPQSPWQQHVNKW